jgi:hypothetical protein
MKHFKFLPLDYNNNSKNYNTIKDAAPSLTRPHHIPDGYNVDNILNAAEEVNSIPDNHPIMVDIDEEQLLNSFTELAHRLGYASYQDMEVEANQWFSEKWKSLGNPTTPIFFDLNLSYKPGLTGKDRYLKNRGHISWQTEQGYFPGDATEFLEELDGLYIKTIIDSLIEWHETNFQRKWVGGIRILWVNPCRRYNLHNDANLYLRYHVPITTRPDVQFLCRDEGDTDKYYKMHMPVGEAWMLIPKMLHTVINPWDKPRAHLILTEYREPGHQLEEATFVLPDIAFK